MMILLIGSESLSMLRVISLHAHAYKLMLCIVFMEVSGGQLPKYISGGKKNPFQQVAWWTTSFIFLTLTLAAAQQVFKKYHARYHALDAVAAPRHCHWWVQLTV